MDHVNLQKSEGIATLVLSRGKVNAINGEVVGQLKGQLQSLEVDPDVRAIILTGSGKFFSFGFDIPEFLSFSKEQFKDYLQHFTGLYTYLFSYPKPVVAAINGHAIAGGCMLALACDQRVMVTGKARIALNEIGFGASLLAGATEMLRFAVGNSNATQVLYSGALYSAEEALGLGLVDQAVPESDLMDVARGSAIGDGSEISARLCRNQEPSARTQRGRDDAQGKSIHRGIHGDLVFGIHLGELEGNQNILEGERGDLPSARTFGGHSDGGKPSPS